MLFRSKKGLSEGAPKALVPVQTQTGTNSRHWSRFELLRPGMPMVPVRMGVLSHQPGLKVLAPLVSPGSNPHSNRDYSLLVFRALAARTGTNARHWSRFVSEPGLMALELLPKDSFSTSVTTGASLSTGTSPPTEEYSAKYEKHQRQTCGLNSGGLGVQPPT